MALLAAAVTNHFCPYHQPFLSTLPLFDRDEGEGEVAFAAELAVDFELGGAEEELSAALEELARHLAEVAGLDDILELDVIQTRIESDVAGNFVLYKDGATLGHDFALDYTRHHRIAREMPAGKKLILLDPVLRMSVSGIVDKGFFNQKHRFPMGQETLDVLLAKFGHGTRIWFRFSTVLV